jgi:hypothetical protein
MNVVVARVFGNLFVGYSVNVVARAFWVDLRRYVFTNRYVYTLYLWPDLCPINLTNY